MNDQRALPALGVGGVGSDGGCSGTTDFPHPGHLTLVIAALMRVLSRVMCCSCRKDRNGER